jgi:hypothetical protein
VSGSTEQPGHNRAEQSPPEGFANPQGSRGSLKRAREVVERRLDEVLNPPSTNPEAKMIDEGCMPKPLTPKQRHQLRREIEEQLRKEIRGEGDLH